MIEKVNKTDTEQIFSEMKCEIGVSKRVYLEKCILQPNYSKKDYRKLKREAVNELKERKLRYKERKLKCEKFLKANPKDSSNGDLKYEYLAQIIGSGSSIPSDYMVLVEFYFKKSRYQDAYDICEKWFAGDVWFIPRLAGYSLYLLDRMEKAKTKLQNFNSIDLDFVKSGRTNDLLGARELIKQGANVNVRDKNCKTALHYAIQNNCVEMVKLLTDNGADVNITNDNFSDKFAIINAAKIGNVEIIKLLVSKGADINLQEIACPSRRVYRTPLIEAIMNGHVDVAKFLINCGADVNCCSYSSSPLIAAIEKGNTQLISHLIKMEADVNLEVKEYLSPDEYGSILTKAPILAAINRANQELLQKKVANEDILKILIEHGVDLQRKFTGTFDIGKNYRRFGKNINVIEYFLDAIDMFDQTVNQRYLYIIRILLDGGIQPRIKKHKEQLQKLLIQRLALLLVWEQDTLYDLAIKNYDKAIELNPQDAETYNNRGGAYYSNCQYDLAIKDYDKAIELNPRYAEAYNNRGNVYDSKGEYDLAIKDFNKAIDLNPQYSMAYDSKGEYDLVIKDFNKAIELNPQDSKAYYNRGNIYFSKGEYDLAIKNYNKAIEFNPQDAEAYSNRGSAYDAKGQYDLAIKDYNKAIELIPQDETPYNNRGNAYDAKGQYDLAIKDFNKAIELNPKFTYAYFNRGGAHYSKCQYDLAIEDYDKAIELNPQFKDAYLRKAVNCEESGSKFEAIQAYKLFLQYASRTDPDVKTVKQLLLFLESEN